VDSVSPTKVPRLASFGPLLGLSVAVLCCIHIVPCAGGRRAPAQAQGPPLRARFARCRAAQCSRVFENYPTPSFPHPLLFPRRNAAFRLSSAFRRSGAPGLVGWYWCGLPQVVGVLKTRDKVCGLLSVGEEGGWVFLETRSALWAPSAEARHSLLASRAGLSATTHPNAAVLASRRPRR